MKTKPTHIAFEQRYSDDSGIEFAVRLNPDQVHGSRIELEHVGVIAFPLDQIGWLIECLQYIKKEVAGDN